MGAKLEVDELKRTSKCPLSPEGYSRPMLKFTLVTGPVTLHEFVDHKFVMGCERTLPQLSMLVLE